MTAVINILYLTGSMFMLEVYDRVLPSRSVPTLAGLAIIAATLYGFQGVLDVLRGRILVRIGGSIDEALSGRVFEAVTRLPLQVRSSNGLQPLRDLDQVRAFLSSLGPAALFDLPWLPLYLAICFAFHWMIGTTALVGGIVLVAITLLAEALTKHPVRAAAGHGARRNVLAEAGRRNAEVLQAMGMSNRMAAIWGEANSQYMTSNRRAADVAGGLGAISKVLRVLLQSAVLGIGAYLVINQEATAGIIIASSILTARALAPVELVIANWKGFIAARQGWTRLGELMRTLPAPATPMELPRPAKSLIVEGLSVAPPGGAIVVRDVAFRLEAGDGLGIVGPNASGKSSLARALVGAWRPARGQVRLDGAALEQWAPEALGRHVGYLPQDVELFDGTVAENISRFEPEPNAEAITRAAVAAGVDQLILRLPEGYDSPIGESGAALSAGQRQRVALARALYGDPFLVVLDEPNSNLDAEGEAALTRAILGARARGAVVVTIAHRPGALAGVDKVLMLHDGVQRAFGPKDEVLEKVLRPLAATPVPLKPVPERV